VTASDFFLNSATAIENKNGCLLMVDCEYSLIQSQCRKADIEISNH